MRLWLGREIVVLGLDIFLVIRHKKCLNNSYKSLKIGNYEHKRFKTKENRIYIYRVEFT